MRRPCTNAAKVFFLIVAIVGLCLADSLAQIRSKDLPANYRQWLEGDVAYVITKEERAAFLQLTNSEGRDQFIEHFWEIRNPSPGAPTNSYKDEHYRRIEYANQHFGAGAAGEGWRTDRGRIYITLGPPQQKALYTSGQNLRPIEIWFYSSTHPALPAFFYIVFYKRDDSSDFRLYSPYMDGPERLITTLRASTNRMAALQTIETSLGREVARTTLSLIPDEPVDMSMGTSSMASDVMLGTIHDLANNRFTKEELNQRRALLESVTHRLILEGEFLDVLTVPLRTADGKTNLHYLLSLRKPENFAVAQTDRRYYYSVDVSARVLTVDNKMIFGQDRKLSRYIEGEDFETLKGSVFEYEGLLPLPPGEYKVEFVLSNVLRKTAYREVRQVEVPPADGTGLTLTAPTPFSDARAVDPSAAGSIPFSAAGVKFTPMIGQELNLSTGSNLNVFYQIWAPPADPKVQRGRKLQVDYVYGRVALPNDATPIHDEIRREQFDAHGSMVNGKKLPLSNAPAGNYRLVITVTDPESRQKAFGSLNFRIASADSRFPSWHVYDKAFGDDVHSGLADYQRGLCYLSEGKREPASAAFRDAVVKNPNNEMARSRLVELDFAEHKYEEIIAVHASAGISAETDEQTILHIAESVNRLGDTRRAIRILESTLGLKPPSRALFLTLASYYQRVGDLRKANEWERRSQTLTASVPPTS